VGVAARTDGAASSTLGEILAGLVLTSPGGVSMDLDVGRAIDACEATGWPAGIAAAIEQTPVGCHAMVVYRAGNTTVTIAGIECQDPRDGKGPLASSRLRRWEGCSLPARLIPERDVPYSRVAFSGVCIRRVWERGLAIRGRGRRRGRVHRRSGTLHGGRAFCGVAWRRREWRGTGDANQYAEGKTPRKLHCMSVTQAPRPGAVDRLGPGRSALDVMPRRCRRCAAFGLSTTVCQLASQPAGVEDADRCRGRRRLRAQSIAPISCRSIVDEGDDRRCVLDGSLCIGVGDREV
jgi:hypothetical protein